ncbi:Rha family transcriptional regulator [Methylobacterium sp. WL9]|uniref:Rha family transcriptional regulator n=1 Tax=Methylobacterium sp. WL9 TaxID=2603898 RepID=UPI0011CB68E6|nr:Rha family transcriptional regulator [Methylobacterium sp. WL9]TXN19961.1 Rha family transcriptional regulator [Methylobacterium sp. WL9]
MSSREIAELTYKRHDHVMADIRVMLKALGGDPCFRGTYQTAQGKTAPCFNFSKRETIILVTGYSIPLRAAVVDRWAELEAQIAGDSPKVPQTRAQALRLAADQAEHIETLETENAAMKAETAPMSAPRSPNRSNRASSSGTFQEIGAAVPEEWYCISERDGALCHRPHWNDPDRNTSPCSSDTRAPRPSNRMPA